jgi:hypothetical protein
MRKGGGGFLGFGFCTLQQFLSSDVGTLARGACEGKVAFSLQRLQ